MKGRRGRRPKQLLDKLKETRGCRNFKEEAPDRTVRGTRFVKGSGPLIRQAARRIKM